MHPKISFINLTRRSVTSTHFLRKYAVSLDASIWIGRGEAMTREVSGSGRKWKQARSHYRSFRPVWGDQSDKCLSHQHQGLRLSGPSLHQMQFVNNSCRVDTRWMARVLCVKKCWSHVSKGQDNVKILAWTGSYLLLIINKWWNFQEVL